MYIHNLNADWTKHPFLRSRFLVKSQEEADKIARLDLDEIDIDTGKGLDITAPAPPPPATAEATPAEAADPAAPQKHERRGRAKIVPPEQISLRSELTRARAIYGEASSVVQSLLVDARLGRQIEAEKIQPSIAAITGSVLRNPDAMISLFRVKQADKYTFQHSVAVSTLLIAFGRSLGLDREVIEQIGLGGMLHDIGKVKVPSYILTKPGKLTEAEFAVMKKHVEYGAALLENASGIAQPALDVVWQHHERCDGSGYPRQLRGGELSRFGQMAAIVDIYDAMTSDHVYQRNREPTEALQWLMEMGNRQFEAELVQRFVRGIGIYPVGSLVRLESELLAVVIDQRRDKLLCPKVRAVFSVKAESFVTPMDIDLAADGSADRIVGYESPLRWKIDPRRFF
jgi:putative nucleotidyltransferase with HDIG domain